MWKKKKSKNVEVVFLQDYENYKKWVIWNVSQVLFSNKLNRNNIAKKLLLKISQNIIIWLMKK